MRRKDREITHIRTILDLVSECKVCRLAMTDGGVPYIVPLNYGYEYADGALTFYFHSAKEGRKLEILKKNPTVCLEAGASLLKPRTPAPMATPSPAS